MTARDPSQSLYIPILGHEIDAINLLVTAVSVPFLQLSHRKCCRTGAKGVPQTPTDCDSIHSGTM